MIVGVLLRLIGGVVSSLLDLLPTSTLDLPVVGGTVGEWIGSHAGPIDKIVPLHEAVVVSGILLATWLPAVITYTLMVWVYAHIPFMGKG